MIDRANTNEMITDFIYFMKILPCCDNPYYVLTIPAEMPSCRNAAAGKGFGRD
jgi:hypothetical protein